MVLAGRLAEMGSLNRKKVNILAIWVVPGPLVLSHQSTQSGTEATVQPGSTNKICVMKGSSPILFSVFFLMLGGVNSCNGWAESSLSVVPAMNALMQLHV